MGAVGGVIVHHDDFKIHDSLVHWSLVRKRLVHKRLKTRVQAGFFVARWHDH